MDPCHILWILVRWVKTQLNVFISSLQDRATLQRSFFFSWRRLPWIFTTSRSFCSMTHFATVTVYDDTWYSNQHDTHVSCWFPFVQYILPVLLKWSKFTHLSLFLSFSLISVMHLFVLFSSNQISGWYLFFFSALQLFYVHFLLAVLQHWFKGLMLKSS